MNTILIFFLIVPSIYGLYNQDRSIDISKYDCIVKFNLDYTYCTGTFISDNVLITAQHCIPEYYTSIYINNSEITDYEYTAHSFSSYDLGYIKFNKFKYKCSSYFKLSSNYSNLKYPSKLRTCGYGHYNTSRRSTDKEFGCKDLDVSLHTKNYYYHSGLSTQPGDSGSPLFTRDNTIYGIHSSGCYKYSFSEIVNITHFNSWYYNNASLLNHNKFIYVILFIYLAMS